MIFLIATLAIFLPVFLGGLLAWLVAGADGQVTTAKLQIEENEKAYNPLVTLGHKIKAQASKEMQLLEARRLAAKKAAQTPRGANMRIGRLGQENLTTAGKVEALAQDPLTAVRIAAYHGWDGAKVGAVTMEDAPKAAGAGASISRIKLAPGKDYAKIDIVDSMSLPEKRKARIANAKARSAAIKAAKAAGVAPTPYGGAAAAATVQAAAAPAEASAAAPATAAPAAAPTMAAIHVAPPQLIEITESMSPDETRKARISNSKATSAFNKALKEAGIDPKSVEIVDGKVVMAGSASAAPAAAATAVADAAPVVATETAAAPVTAVAAIPQPEYIDITDDMSPEDARKARITNSKLKSEYNKALKAAGIDPKTVA